MGEEEIILLNNTYSLIAPTMLNETRQSSGQATIETAIGILCACVTLSAVLLFLWKFVKSKQESMISSLQDELSRSENGKSSSKRMLPGTERSSNTPSTGSLTSMQNAKEFELATQKKAISSRPQAIINKSLKNYQQKDNEAILVGRRTLSRRKRTGSRSVAYSLRDYKCYTDLETYDAKDMMLSLKDERASIRDRVAKRKDAVEKASKCLEECVSILAGLKKSVNEAINKSKANRATGAAKKIKSVVTDLTSKYAFPHDSSIRWNSKPKDSFDSLQCCLQGLRCHKEAKRSLKDLSVLREGHRLDNEKDIKQKYAVAKSTSAIRECQESIRQAKSRMKELAYQNLSHTSTTRRSQTDNKRHHSMERPFKSHPKKNFVSHSSKVYPEQTRPSDKIRMTSKSANALGTNKRRATAVATQKITKNQNTSKQTVPITQDKQRKGSRYSETIK